MVKRTAAVHLTIEVASRGRYGTMKLSGPDCSSTSTAMASTRTTDQPITLRKMSPSRPAQPTEAAPMARF